MTARGIEKQAEMMSLTGWSKATMSQLYNGVQDYSPKIIREASEALKVAPYELLMHPEEANAIRRLRQEALRVVEASRPLAGELEPDEAHTEQVTPNRKRG
jgi:transcriptional regulator with XRE-family HTH domain